MPTETQKLKSRYEISNHLRAAVNEIARADSYTDHLPKYLRDKILRAYDIGSEARAAIRDWPVTVDERARARIAKLSPQGRK